MRTFLSHFMIFHRRRLLLLSLGTILLMAFPMLIAATGLSDPEVLQSGQNPFTQSVSLVFATPRIGYDPQEYKLPFFWVFHHVLAIFPSCLMLWSYHQSFGAQHVLSMRSRQKYFLRLLIFALLLPLWVGALRLVVLFLSWIYVGGAKMGDIHFLFRLFAMFMVEDMFFCLLSTTIALDFGLRFGLLTSLALMILSTFFPTPFLPGQASMAIRQQSISENGFTWQTEMVIYLLYFVILLFVYRWRMKLYDFIFKQE